jgi:hypothetical protein
MYNDEWISGFSTKAAPRLREMFEQELGDLPPLLATLLQQLKETEKVLPLAGLADRHSVRDEHR